MSIKNVETIRPAQAPGLSGRRSRGVLSLRDRSEEALIADMPWLEPWERDPLRKLARHLMREASIWEIQKAQRLAEERGRL